MGCDGRSSYGNYSWSIVDLILIYIKKANVNVFESFKGIHVDFMEEKELIPKLFRTEYRNIVSVLSYLFGIEHIEVAEDIVSDTFLTAMETWSLKGIPDNPTGWLYTVAKNKTLNYLKRNSLFEKKLATEIRYTSEESEELEIDLSTKNISDSQLAMIFAICNPCNASETQIALALNVLCGFGIQEIADAFLTNKEVVYKRISRGKERLKEKKIKIEQPSKQQIDERLDAVLTTIYLLFSEGYYATSHNTLLRRDLCDEAIRLTQLLATNENTGKSSVDALLALMYFHSSRFEARTNADGETILYEDQDESLWDQQHIEKGIYYLNKASRGIELTRYHLEAGIAYWHTLKEDIPEKWEEILQLYNSLLILEYSPIAALNRTYALSKARGKLAAIVEAEKLDLVTNHFYYSLLGNLYTDIDNKLALQHFERAYDLATSPIDKATVNNHILTLRSNM